MYDMRSVRPQRFQAGWLTQPGWMAAVGFSILAGVLCLSVWLKHHRQQQFVRQIKRLGATIERVEGGPPWLRNLLGADLLALFDRVEYVHLPVTILSDEHCSQLLDLRHLHELALVRTNLGHVNTEVVGRLTRLDYVGFTATRDTDAGLQYCRNMSHLRQLALCDTDVTDAGLQHLGGLQQLQTLKMPGCRRVTGAGLAHLAELPRLERMNLARTRIADEDLAHLSALKSLKAMDLQGTRITDAGLVHLAALDLQELRLTDTRITDAGVACLAGLTNLQSLYINRTEVTREGRQELCKALPYCQVLPRP